MQKYTFIISYCSKSLLNPSSVFVIFRKLNFGQYVNLSSKYLSNSIIYFIYYRLETRINYGQEKPCKLVSQKN